jgi:dUTP pyrophosphatase
VIVFNGVIPKRGTQGAAGYDLTSRKAVTIFPGAIEVIPSGTSAHFPANVVGMVCSRSGLSTKGIMVVNAPGIIDSDYNKPIDIIITNIGKEPFYVTPGMRIAQIIFTPVILGTEIVTTVREGGLGSTGE